MQWNSLTLWCWKGSRMSFAALFTILLLLVLTTTSEAQLNYPEFFTTSPFEYENEGYLYSVTFREDGSGFIQREHVVVDFNGNRKDVGPLEMQELTWTHKYGKGKGNSKVCITFKS